MSPFWQNEYIDLNSSQVIYKYKNKSSFNQNQKSQLLSFKAPYNTVHQILRPNLIKISSKKQQIPQKTTKKNRFLTIYQGSTFSFKSKNLAKSTPIINFSQALLKIEEIFFFQCNMKERDFYLKLKQGQIRNGLKEFQSLGENSKFKIQKEFQEIFRIFTITPFLHRQSIQKSQSSVISSKIKQKYTFMSTNQGYINKTQSFGYQKLSEYERKVFLKQTKAFKKAEQHFMLKSYTVRLFYNHLNTQLELESGALEDALQSLWYCEYYARKIDFDQYIIPCLVMQAEINQSLYETEACIKILKTALEFSIIKRWKQLQMRLLQKISMVYYYLGNSYMAKYYKQISENGLPKSDTQAYLKEYSKSEEIKSLEARLFSLPDNFANKKKNNLKYEQDISRDLFQNHENIIKSQHVQVSSMLTNNKIKHMGIKLRKMILKNCQQGKAKKFNKQKGSSQILPRFKAFQYPFQNCNQVIKSHLSKSRVAFSNQVKNVNFRKTFSFMKSLYDRLLSEIKSQKNQKEVDSKKNIALMV